MMRRALWRPQPWRFGPSHRGMAGPESDANLPLMLASDAVEHRTRSSDPGLGESAGHFGLRGGEPAHSAGPWGRQSSRRAPLSMGELRYLLRFLPDFRTAADVVGRVAGARSRTRTYDPLINSQVL